MCSITLTKKINYKNTSNNCYELSVKGLIGGHSGDDIDKNRCNAIKLVIHILKQLDCTEIVSVDIGKRDNVIPSDGNIIFSSNQNLDEIKDKIDNIVMNLKNNENNISYDIKSVKNTCVIEDSQDIINFLDKIKNGLLETFKKDGFPLISSNIGKLSIENNQVIIKYSIRSSDVLKEENLLEETSKLASKYGFEFILDARKPFFPYKENSNIRNLLSETYKELYDKDTITRKIHACMEGGIISNNIENLDIVTIAPTIEDCHSIKEKVSISSAIRVYEWLQKTLKKFNG